MDSLKCQTSTVTPAEPGGFPVWLRDHERHGDWHRQRHLRPRPGEPHGRPHRLVPHQPPQARAGRSSDRAPRGPDAGLSDKQRRESVGHLDFLDAVVSIHLNIILGLLLYEPIVEMGLKVPLFETRLFAVILLTNVMPRNL